MKNNNVNKFTKYAGIKLAEKGFAPYKIHSNGKKVLFKEESNDLRKIAIDVTSELEEDSRFSPEDLIFQSDFASKMLEYGAYSDFRSSNSNSDRGKVFEIVIARNRELNGVFVRSCLSDNDF